MIALAGPCESVAAPNQLSNWRESSEAKKNQENIEYVLFYKSIRFKIVRFLKRLMIVKAKTFFPILHLEKHFC